MRDVLLDRAVSLTSGRILPILPISFFPPYGAEREKFSRFLEAIPEGGLGFHSTSSKYADSISAEGLNPALGHRFSLPTVHYEILDPVTDPVMHEARGNEGTVATYHRLKNGLIKIILKYGDASAWRSNNSETPEEPYRAAVVVFSNASGLVTEEITRRNEIYHSDVSRQEYYRPAMRARLDHRMFYRTRAEVGYGHPGSVDDLPATESDFVPPENIVDIFVADKISTLGLVTRTPDHVVRLAEKITKSLVNRYVERE